MLLLSNCTFEEYDNVIDSIVKQDPSIVGIYPCTI